MSAGSTLLVTTPPFVQEVPELTPEELRMQLWVKEAELAGRTKAPPPTPGKAGTVEHTVIQGMELEKWNGAHLEHYSRPTNHVFPLFRYEPPDSVTQPPLNSDIEARVSQLVTARMSTASALSSFDQEEKEEKEERKRRRVLAKRARNQSAPRSIFGSTASSSVVSQPQLKQNRTTTSPLRKKKLKRQQTKLHCNDN